MNVRSFLGISFLTACSSPVPMASGNELDASHDVASDVLFDTQSESVRDVVANVMRDVPVDVLLDSSSDAGHPSLDAPHDIDNDASDDVPNDVSNDGHDVADTLFIDHVDVSIPTRMARDLGVSLPCSPIALSKYSSTLLGLCPDRRFFQVDLVSHRITLRTELPSISGEDLRQIVGTVDVSGVVLGLNSVYQIDRDSSGTNVRTLFPSGHLLSGGGVFVSVGSMRKFYAATFYTDSSYSGGEVLVYDVSLFGNLTARRTSLSDGGATHQHITVSGQPVATALSPTSPVSEVFVLTVSPNTLVRLRPIDDINMGGRRLPSTMTPIPQQELQLTADGHYAVFGAQEDQVVVVDTSVSVSTTMDGVTVFPIPDGRITDVRVVNQEAYVATDSGRIFHVSIPSGALMDIFTTGTSRITASAQEGTNLFFSGGGRLYAIP